MDSKAVSEIVKNYAQVAGWIAAAFYFAVKFIQGYTVIDMSVKVSLERQHSPTSADDFVAATVEFKRGDRGAFRIHEATLIVRQESGEQVIKLPFDRFSFRHQNGLLSIRFDKLSSRVPTLNLAPGETATASTVVKVNRNQPCIVEAFIIGTGFASLTVGQWRASAVSLPLADLTEAA